jgi:hypothetical protein
MEKKAPRTRTTPARVVAIEARFLSILLSQSHRKRSQTLLLIFHYYLCTLLSALFFYSMKMITETITVKRDPTIDFFLRKIAEKKAKYVVFIDGEAEFELNPITKDDEGNIDDSEQERQARLEAQKELERGETLHIEDISKLNADEFQDLIAKHLSKYEV